MDNRILLDHVDSFAARVGQRPELVMRRATGNPRVYERMRRRLALDEAVAAAVLEYIAANQPGDAA